MKRYKEPSAELLGAKAKSGREKKAERAQSSVKRDAAKEVSGTRMKQGVVVRMVHALACRSSIHQRDVRLEIWLTGLPADDGGDLCNVQRRWPLHSWPSGNAAL